MTSLQDPQLKAFWASNPELLVDPNTLEPSGPPSTERPTREKVEVEMAAAVVVAAVLIRRHLQQQPPPQQPQAVAGQAWRHYAPVWMRFMVPAVKQAYRLGRVSNLSPEEVDALASSYAEELGEYMNESSAQTLVDGFNQQLAGSKWSREVAWQRASAAYGVDAANMRGIMATLVNFKDNGGPPGDPVTAAAKLAIDKALLARAELVGETEQHRASQMGLAMSWLVRQQRGELQGAKRRWLTRNHERDCPICGPMDGAEAYLDTFFVLPDSQQLWAPGAHPRCECENVLVNADGEVISKAMGSDPYDRLKDGRFAATEHRSTQLKFSEPVAPEVQNILDEVSRLNAFGVDMGKPLFEAPSQLFTADPLFQQGGQLFQAPDALFAPKATIFGDAAGLFDEAPAKAALKRNRKLILITRKRPGPPPAPKHETHYLPADDVADYFLEMWGDIPDGFGGAVVDFDDINDYYTELHGSEDDGGRAEAAVAWPQASIWSSVPPQVWEVTPAQWRDTMAIAEPLWHQSLHAVDSTVAQLSDMDLRYIVSRAGYPMINSDQMREAIATVVHDPNAPDRSLEEAYADYVTWSRPDLLGEGGQQLSYHLAAMLGDNDSTDFQVDPSPVFSFTQGFNFDTPSLVGPYEISHVIYHSAIAEWGREAPLGHLSIHEMEMEPFVGGPRRDDLPVDLEPDKVNTEDKHPWD